jgi:hypothetical protein
MSAEARLRELGIELPPPFNIAVEVELVAEID